MPRCDACRFFHPHPPADEPQAIVIAADRVSGGGECRVRPPVRLKDKILASFPVVYPQWWCGRFEASK